MAEEELNISLDEFRMQCADDQGVPQRGRMNFTARPTPETLTKYTPMPTKAKPNPEPEVGTIHFEFNNDSNVGIKQLKNFAHEIDKQSYYTGVFVSTVAPTAAALKLIPTLLPKILEVFKEEDLLVNITKHELVPKHQVLSPEEKKYLLQRYRLKETQLPRIKSEDPVAKYLGVRKGQVVKIIRKSETAGRYASYRWCI